MNTKLRSYTIYIAAFVLTLAGSLLLAFAQSVYENRQGVFISAAMSGRVNTMRLVEMLGVDVNEPACTARNCILPLVAAAWGGHNEAVEFLLDRGADINEGGKFDRTPLMIASFCGEAKIVKLLIDRGADVNLTNSDGDSALSVARERNQQQVIRLLLKAGARDREE